MNDVEIYDVAKDIAYRVGSYTPLQQALILNAAQGIVQNNAIVEALLLRGPK